MAMVQSFKNRHMIYLISFFSPEHQRRVPLAAADALLQDRQQPPPQPKRVLHLARIRRLALTRSVRETHT